MNAPIKRLVTRNRHRLRQLCAGLQVRELCLFGSATSGEFDPASSDIDVVVDFLNPEAPGIADRYLALAEGLEAIFQRPVDLVTRQAMRNPVFRRTVEETSEPLYLSRLRAARAR